MAAPEARRKRRFARHWPVAARSRLARVFHYDEPVAFLDRPEGRLAIALGSAS
jgi:hypothetical protein